jgi:hypothetical protein
MLDVLGFDALFAEMILGVGLALIIGNMLALRKHRRGEQPEGVEGEFRTGRVFFLTAVGVLMTVWGLASIIV